jgi:SAM-dependent methyltransferase
VNEREFRTALVDAAAAPYRQAGRFAWHFARGKVGSDPAFLALLRLGLVPPNARVLDLGCGQGLLASTLVAADALHTRGTWPAGWPPAPSGIRVHGVELMPRDVDRARRALGDRASVEQGDIRSATFDSVDAVVILDVLHYIPPADQEAVLVRVRHALSPGGVLLLRVGDAAAGWPFKVSQGVDRVVTFVRGHRLGQLHCRPLREWIDLLTAIGFAVEAMPMSQGTPFANVLLVGRVG